MTRKARERWESPSVPDFKVGANVQSDLPDESGYVGPSSATAFNRDLTVIAKHLMVVTNSNKAVGLRPRRRPRSRRRGRQRARAAGGRSAR